MELRPYQKAAVRAVLEHFRDSGQAACLVLPTGAGKSLVIGELARVARGRVVVLAHVKELCQQNHAKYLTLGGEAGLFSAGLGEKNSEERVTFASIQSAARHATAFLEPVSLLVIDECHRVSGEEGSQYSAFIDHLRQGNPELKVLGLTATPYRLGMGWCYQRHARGIVRTDEERPFARCVYEVTLRQMLAGGYLTEPQIEDAPVAQYDFSSLEAQADGQVVEREANELLVRHQRVTQSICEQIVDVARREERKGVMVFAATVDHAREIAGYLPQSETGLILGETGQEQRDATISDFVAQRLRYLVNVSVLTTGFDAPHVDYIALLRKTESVSLYQQIVGRGLRLFPGKKNCRVTDYAGAGFDLFSPEIGEKRPTSDSVIVTVPCPVCQFDNEFWGQQDEDGHVLEHFGRRCHGELNGQRCDYRFRFKECGRCLAENDIAARACGACGEALVDPDEFLKKALRLKDARVLRVSGKELQVEGTKLQIRYHDEDGATVSETFDFAHVGQRAVFNRIFGRRLASGRRPLELEHAAQAVALTAHLPTPDFVVARKQKIRGGKASYYRVEKRVFDYAGRLRTADQS